MKSKIFGFLFSLLCLLSTQFAIAQNENVGSLNEENNVLIPPLQVVIDSVLKHHAMLKFRNQSIGVKEATLNSEKIYWTRNFGIQAETKYGNLNSFSTDSDGSISSTALITTEQVNYSVGFYLKFPIFDVLNRKNQLKLAKLEVEEAKSMAQFQEDEIRQTVIKLYHNLILKQKLLKIKSESLGSGKVNMQMAEKEFRNGSIELTEYARISGITSNLESDFELAKSEFLIAKSILEDMAGFTFGLTN